ncbi:MAG: M23 family metallopeptidase [Acidobacteria bacterium]|nr:M23 family metallopeptidase [Acidobacteriota bacterium]
MRRIPTRAAVIAMLAASAVALPAALSGTGITERKQAVDQRLYSAEARLMAVINRQAVLTSDLASVNGRLRDVIRRLEPLAERRDAAVAAHRMAIGTLAQVNRDLSFQRRQLGIATGRLKLQRQALVERIREIYRTQDDDPLLGLLQGGSLAELAGAATGIERVTDGDRDMIAAVARYRNLTRSSAARIAVLQDRAAAAEDRAAERAASAKAAAHDLDVEQRVLRRTKRVRARMLATIRVDRGHIEDDTKALREQSFSLARRIAEIQGVPYAEPSDVTPSEAGFTWPTSGQITSGFGPRWGRMHEGLDIAAPIGRPITAAKSGKVIVAGPSGGYGNLVVIDHGGGLSTAYGHQSRIAVAVGDVVTQGGLVGYVGSTGHSTGPHLHFEVRVNGAARNPLPYL